MSALTLRCDVCGEIDDAGHDGALCSVCENGRLRVVPQPQQPE
jgi:hypothetical protein